nr:alpha/beta hydrolase [Burkholderiaceae bacterium]
QARSAGITDLRFGNVQAAEGPARDRHAQRHDDRVPTPLPEGVAVFMVAATRAERIDAPLAKLAGDGLVPVASALGRHADARHALTVAPDRELVVPAANHWDLLGRRVVYPWLRRSLAGTG